MGNVRTYAIPHEWTCGIPDGEPGYGDLDLTTLADQPAHVPAFLATASEGAGFKPDSISRLEEQLIGSGGFDNLALMTLPEQTSLIGWLWATLAAVRFIRRPLS